MASHGMLRRVALVRADVSEELSASIIKVTRIGELGTLAVTDNRRTLRCRGQENGNLFVRSPSRLHGALLSSLAQEHVYLSSYFTYHSIHATFHLPLFTFHLPYSQCSVSKLSSCYTSW
jgi:hypothetical protein